MLFRLDPEQAHESALRLAHLPGAALVARLMGCRPVNDPVTLFGVPFANRIGLAAGLDKNGRHIDALAALGFGFLEVGTVTPRAQPGNARPRLFRIASHEALINRFGFNNEGLDVFLANVKRSRFRGTLGLNIGKNADTPNERSDRRLCRGPAPMPPACLVHHRQHFLAQHPESA